MKNSIAEDKQSHNRTMRVFRKLRSGRKRSSTASQEAKLLLSGPNYYPSEGSSDSSWGNESSLSGSANPLYLCSDTASVDDTVTESSSLPTHLEDFEDDSPTNWSRRTANSNKVTMVVYGHPPRSPRSLPDSITTWLYAADALVRSKEMRNVIGSSCDLMMSTVVAGRNVVFTAGGIAVDVALLPVTLPLHVASTATALVAGVAGSVVNKVIGREDPSREEESDNASPIDSFIHNVFNIIPFVMKEVGSAAGHVLGLEHQSSQGNQASSRQSSPGRGCATPSGESSVEREHILERLRLDFTPKKESSDHVFSRASPSDISKFLLRVDDIIVMVSPDPTMTKIRPRKAHFVDIGSEFADDSTTRDALAKLWQRGIDIAATNTSAHLGLSGHQTNSPISIQWKAEGHTARTLRKMAQIDREELYQKLASHVLVWSGKYNGPKYYGSDNPLFLARGIVRRSPRDFFEMLWDSDRTGEYNNFSLGRTDMLVVDDSISSKGDSGAKVIKSDTRVPFAGITVSFSALMYGKKLKEGPEDGYVIVSRSLSSGMAGCHVGSSKHIGKDNKNEILLGVNIMRPVPGHPELTDLMSVSQVSSSMVPQFLAFRIGMMGLEDFFSNVRKV